MRRTAETRSPEDLEAVARFKYLTEVELPRLAQTHHWPIRLDHCFKRICLDWTFGQVWHQALPRPAERHLRGEALRAAVQCADELVAGGPALLLERDAASLHWRGKPPKRAAHPTSSAANRHSTPEAV